MKFQDLSIKFTGKARFYTVNFQSKFGFDDGDFETENADFTREEFLEFQKQYLAPMVTTPCEFYEIGSGHNQYRTDFEGELSPEIITMTESKLIDCLDKIRKNK